MYLRVYDVENMSCDTKISFSPLAACAPRQLHLWHDRVRLSLFTCFTALLYNASKGICKSMQRKRNIHDCIKMENKVSMLKHNGNGVHSTATTLTRHVFCYALYIYVYVWAQLSRFIYYFLYFSCLELVSCLIFLRFFLALALFLTCVCVFILPYAALIHFTPRLSGVRLEK